MTLKPENIKPMPKGKESKEEEAICLPVHAGVREPFPSKELSKRKSIGTNVRHEIVGVVIQDQRCPICSFTYPTVLRSLTQKEISKEIIKMLEE